MTFRLSSSCYRKLLIAALAVAAWLSGDFACAEPILLVQAAQEDSKKSDPPPKDEKKPEEAKEPQTTKASAQEEKKPVVVTEEQLSETQTPDWHRVQMRLSGSLCYACLKDLEDNLEKIPGVWRAKIDRAKPNYFSAVSPDIQSYAEGVVLVDEKKLPIENLRAAIKQNAYHSYRIMDKALGHQPDEKDLKL